MTRLHFLRAAISTAIVALAPAYATAQSTPQARQPAKQWPVTVQSAQSPAKAEPDQWSEAEQIRARAVCSAILAKHNIVAKALPPIKDGECGDPAPLEVTSIGAGPAVTFSEPAILNCRMAAALAEWLAADAQPAARKYLGKPIVGVDVMSSYSCRNAYGRKKARLSEHGLANAIDIGSFDTEGNDRVALLDDWGMTERAIKARIAAAKAADERRRAEAVAKAKATEAEARRQAATRSTPSAQARAATIQPPVPIPSPKREQATAEATSAPVPAPATTAAIAPREPPPAVQAATSTMLRGFITDGFRQLAPNILGSGDGDRALSLEQPSKLGGPKAESSETAAKARPDPREARKKFLRHLHATACKRFGTVLGPEANRAHLNHFHFDLAERSYGSYCR